MSDEKQMILDNVQKTLIDTLYQLVDFINTCQYSDLKENAIITAMEVEDNLKQYFNITIVGYTKDNGQIETIALYKDNELLEGKDF